MSEERYYVPYSVKNPSEATAAFLNITLQHMADFMKAMLEILADKYKLSEEEMMSVLFEHPRYKELAVNPMIHALAAGNAVEAAAVAAPDPSPVVKQQVFIKCADGSIKTVKKVTKVKKGEGTKN
jgi:hypothetical protein